MIQGFNLSIKSGGSDRSSSHYLKGRNMEVYRVKIKTPGSKIVFRGKQIRTPVVLKNVSESELKIIEMFVRKNLLQSSVQLESDALSEELQERLRQEKRIPYEEDLEKDIPIEELKTEPLSLLDKLIESEGNDEETDDLSGKL